MNAINIVPPTGEVVERRTTFRVDHQSPGDEASLHFENGVRIRILWYLAVDGAGRRWKVRPGSGKPPRLVRFYTVKRQHFPVDWKHPMLWPVIVQFNKIRERWRTRRGSKAAVGS